LAKNAATMLEQFDEKTLLKLGKAVGFQPPTADHFLFALERISELDAKSPISQALLSFAAHYLGREQRDGEPLDPVARFHLNNGARIERLNWAGDPTPKGYKQSYGLMVNYLYDLKRLDKHRNMLAQGKIPVSGEVESLYS
jgi:malonyl-CoA decarboxylase